MINDYLLLQLDYQQFLIILVNILFGVGLEQIYDVGIIMIYDNHNVQHHQNHQYHKNHNSNELLYFTVFIIIF